MKQGDAGANTRGGAQDSYAKGHDKVEYKSQSPYKNAWSQGRPCICAKLLMT